MQNEISRVKRGFGSEVEPNFYGKQTNKQKHICKCVFVENCPLQGYYASSTVKNTVCLVTQKSAFLIYLLQKLQIVHLLVCCLSVPLYLVLGY